MVRRKNFGVLASLALVGVCLNAPASYAVIIDGTVSTITSSADLDLDNIIYAVNLGAISGANATTDEVVGGVTFSRTGALPAGVTVSGSSTLGPSFAADLDGGGTGEDALEAVLNTLTFGTGTTGNPFPLITLDTDDGIDYRLQLLIYDAGYSNGRQFDILVDGVLVISDELVGLGDTAGVSNTMGRLYTLDFTADADETQVTFGPGGGSGIDPNPVVSGITLATTAVVPEPASVALLGLLGIALGLGRFRSRKC